MTRLGWLFVATAVLSACNLKCVDCVTEDDPEACRNLQDGRGCMSTTQCAQGLTCFPRNSEGTLGLCRVSCATTACAPRSSTTQGVNCIDLGQPFTPSCVPTPRFDSKWKLVAESLTLPSTNQGRSWDPSPSDEPDPFVCFSFNSDVGQQLLCTDERTGFKQGWTTGFTAWVPWPLLSDVSVTVFESDAFDSFQQCEGACPALATWTKEVVYAKSWDLRPQFAGEDQTFTLSDQSGFQLKLRLRETFESQ